jgi:hypothetical protein
MHPRRVRETSLWIITTFVLPSDRQQGAHCHDPHGCFASLYDPYELFRHDHCDRFSNETMARYWRCSRYPSLLLQ